MKKGIILFGILVLLNCSHPNRARAANFWEAVGISTAVGTVLGLSTLPFYTEPTDHMLNIGIGMGVGFVFGLGLWVYGLVLPSEASSQASLDLKGFRDEPRENFQFYASKQISAPDSTSLWSSPRLSYSELKLWMPVVSLSW